MNEMSPITNHPAVLLKALGRAGRAFEAKLDAALSANGLSIAKLGVLAELVQIGEPLPLGQLAERLACVKSNITQLVDRLEVDGLVRRMPDPEDRRSLRAAITDEGKRRCDLGKKIELQVQREFLQNLSLAEQEQLALILMKFNALKKL